MTHNCNHPLSQRTPEIGTNILPIVTPSKTWANYSQQLYIKIGTILLIAPHSPPIGHLNPYQPTSRPTAFITTSLTMHKHMAPRSRTPNATTHTHPHTPTTDMLTMIYSYQYDHSSYTNTQLVLILLTANGTSRHATKIQILSNNYVTHQCSHTHAVSLEISVMRC